MGTSLSCPPLPPTPVLVLLVFVAACSSFARFDGSSWGSAVSFARVCLARAAVSLRPSNSQGCCVWHLHPSGQTGGFTPLQRTKHRQTQPQKTHRHTDTCIQTDRHRQTHAHRWQQNSRATDVRRRHYFPLLLLPIIIISTIIIIIVVLILFLWTISPCHVFFSSFGLALV